MLPLLFVIIAAFALLVGLQIFLDRGDGCENRECEEYLAKSTFLRK